MILRLHTIMTSGVNKPLGVICIYDPQRDISLYTPEVIMIWSVKMLIIIILLTVTYKHEL